MKTFVLDSGNLIKKRVICSLSSDYLWVGLDEQDDKRCLGTLDRRQLRKLRDEITRVLNNRNRNRREVKSGTWTCSSRSICL